MRGRFNEKLGEGPNRETCRRRALDSARRARRLPKVHQQRRAILERSAKAQPTTRDEQGQVERHELVRTAAKRTQTIDQHVGQQRSQS